VSQRSSTTSAYPIIRLSLLLPRLGISSHASADSTACIRHIEAQTPDHSAEEAVVLHAPSASTVLHASLDEFGEEVVHVQADRLVSGVMQLQVLKGNIADMVASQSRDERQAMLLGHGELRVLEQLRVSILLREVDALEILP